MPRYSAVTRKDRTLDSGGHTHTARLPQCPTPSNVNYTPRHRVARAILRGDFGGCYMVMNATSKADRPAAVAAPRSADGKPAGRHLHYLPPQHPCRPPPRSVTQTPAVRRYALPLTATATHCRPAHQRPRCIHTGSIALIADKLRRATTASASSNQHQHQHQQHRFIRCGG